MIADGVDGAGRQEAPGRTVDLSQPRPHQRPHILLHRASLPLSRRTLAYATGEVRRHRRAIGSKGRYLPPSMQALMTLVYLRKGDTYAELGAGFGVSTTTAWRYVNETVDLLAARAPKLGAALARAVKDGAPYLVLDGTLISIDRVAADRPHYSGKHRRHGMNLQVIATPDGTLLWVSGPLRGSVHDLAAARIWNVVRALAARAARAGRQGLPGRRPAHPQPPTRGATSPNHKRTPTAHTPSFADPANERTPSSNHGESCGSCAAAPTAPAASPKPSTPCKSARPHHAEKCSVVILRRTLSWAQPVGCWRCAGEVQFRAVSRVIRGCGEACPVCLVLRPHLEISQSRAAAMSSARRAGWRRS